LSPRPRAYCVKPVSGKGNGLVATRRLFPGEWILEEIPLLQAETEDFKSETFVASVVGELSKNKRKKFQRLYNAFPEHSDVGILKTNCYGLGCDESRSGVFDKLSHVNHSCRPNAERWWDPDRGMETLYAVREIQENDEITVAYTWCSGKSREERQSYLLRGWRFECHCECCALTGNDRTLSDKRRRLIGKVDDMVGAYDPQKLIPLIKESLECCDKELLFGSTKARICYDGYQLALQIRNLREAKNFIEMAYEEYLLGTGLGSRETIKMAKYVQHPTSHASW
jgi:hypothetical protein